MMDSSANGGHIFYYFVCAIPVVIIALTVIIIKEIGKYNDDRKH